MNKNTKQKFKLIIEKFGKSILKFHPWATGLSP